MKKVLSITAIALFALSFTACKKEYSCCYLDETGAEVSFGGAGCAVVKLSKKDKDQLESDMKAAASVIGWSAKCS